MTGEVIVSETIYVSTLFYKICIILKYLHITPLILYIDTVEQAVAIFNRYVYYKEV